MLSAFYLVGSFFVRVASSEPPKLASVTLSEEVLVGLATYASFAGTAGCTGGAMTV